MNGERLRKRLARKGVPYEEIEKRVAKRIKRLEGAKRFFRNLGGMLTGASRSVGGLITSATPLGNTVGNIVSKVPLIERVPVVKHLALEGAKFVQDGKELGQSNLKIVARDLIPFKKEIEQGNYLRAVIGVLLIVGLTVLSAWLMKRFGVSLPEGTFEFVFQLFDQTALLFERIKPLA